MTANVDQRVKIGIAGLGGHGQTIQRAIEESHGFDVVAVFDPADHEAREAAHRFHCKPAATYEALLAEPELEAVVLVSPNHVHLAQCTAAFEQGLHVFVEKPIANYVDEARQIVEAGIAANKLLMVGHHMRRTHSARIAETMIREGSLGEIASVEVHFSADNTQRMPKNAWRLQPDMCPLMPVMQLGIHAIDTIHCWLGQSKAVTARGRSVTTDPGVIDVVSGLIELENGIDVTFVSNYCTQVLFEIRVSGTTGTLHFRPHSLWYRSSEESDRAGRGPGKLHDFEDITPDAYTLQMIAFAEAIRNGAPVETDGVGGLQALAVVEAMNESVQSGSTVPVPQPVIRQSATS